MDGVSAAYVLLTDQNAYVAIATDDTATGTSARGQVRDQNNTGTMEGIYDPERNTSYAPPNNIVNKTNSDYTIRNPKDLSSKLKQKIAKKVRELHPDIQEVFITANADILNRMNVYAIHAWQGNNLDSYIEEFKNMAKTHFVE